MDVDRLTGSPALTEPSDAGRPLGHLEPPWRESPHDRGLPITLPLGQLAGQHIATGGIVTRRNAVRLNGSVSSLTLIERPEDDPTVSQPDTTLARDVRGWEPEAEPHEA